MIDSTYALKIYNAVFLVDNDYGEANIQGVYDAIATLNEREQRALEHHYKDGYTYSQISKLFGLSRTMGSQIVTKALLKLKHESRSRMMKY
jgi:RNA polymerase sigma factor (sigma-70 family)